MRILLDECLPLDLRHSFPGHDAHSAEWAGLKGRKNGDLLREAELAGYDVLLSVDQGMLHQQNLVGRKLSIVSIVQKKLGANLDRTPRARGQVPGRWANICVERDSVTHGGLSLKR